MLRLPIVNSVMSLVRKSGPPARPQAPRDPSAKLRATFEAAPVGIACVATDGHWLLFNERFREVCGYSRDELTRFTFHDITHPDDAKVEAVLVRRLLRGDVPQYKLEKRVIEKKGKYRELAVTCTVVRTEGGEPEFFIYIADEAPRTAARTTARESEQLLASVLERIREIAIIRTDERGLIVGWNAGAERIFGYHRDEVVGKSRRMLYRDTDTWEGRSTQQLGNATESGRIEFEDWRVRKDGTHLWVATSIMPVRPDGNTVRGFLEIVAPPAKVNEVTRLRAEIDQRERTEDSLREALEEMRRVGSETMNELKIMTGALRNEIDRRKAAEAELEEARVAAECRVDFSPTGAGLTDAGLTDAGLKPGLHADAAIEEQQPEPPTLPKRAWKRLDGPVTEILVAHGAAQRTGTLVIAAPGERLTEVFFENGKIFSVASNNPARFLAQRLVELGDITEDQRQRALEIQRETHLALGRILVILGAIAEERLLEVMRRKSEEEIEATFAWTDAKVAFVEGEIPTLQLVPLRIDVADLVVRRLHDRAMLLTDADVPEMEIPPPVPAPVLPPLDALFFASASGKTRKFHRATCITARRIDEETRVMFTQAEDAMAAGYESCRLCLRD
jgi:PAS domain S-box-containing protein